MLPHPPTVSQALARGLRRRCPRCGVSRIFTRGFTLAERCATCGLVFEGGPGDQFGVMYLTTAVVTVAAFALAISLRPDMSGWTRVLLVAGGVAVMAATLPPRKGLAVAVDYLITRSDGNTHR